MVCFGWYSLRRGHKIPELGQPGRIEEFGTCRVSEDMEGIEKGVLTSQTISCPKRGGTGPLGHSYFNCSSLEMLHLDISCSSTQRWPDMLSILNFPDAMRPCSLCTEYKKGWKKRGILGFMETASIRLVQVHDTIPLEFLIRKAISEKNCISGLSWFFSFACQLSFQSTYSNLRTT